MTFKQTGPLICDVPRRLELSDRDDFFRRNVGPVRHRDDVAGHGGRPGKDLAAARPAVPARVPGRLARRPGLAAARGDAGECQEGGDEDGQDGGEGAVEE